MNRNYYIIKYILVLCIIFIATGCQGTVPKEKDFCHIVLEEGEGFHAEEYALTVERGKDAVFELTLEDGYQLEEVKYGSQSYIKKENKASQGIENQTQKKGISEFTASIIQEERNEASEYTASNTQQEKKAKSEYTVKYDTEGTYLTLTLHNVRYSETIQATISKSDVVIRYHANGGIRCDGGNADEEIAIAVVQSHLRPNTAIGTDLFERTGYTQTGWNTRQDGSGTHIGLGSRVDWEEGMVLYAQWVPWTKASRFQYEIQGEFATITGYQGQEDTLCIPAELEGLTVRRIAENAFAGALCSRVILPLGIYEVENGAFESSALKELYLYDDISKISDYAFTG